MQAAGEASKKEGAAFLAANKSKDDVVALPSGLQYKILTQGTGPKPSASDWAMCSRLASSPSPIACDFSKAACAPSSRGTAPPGTTRTGR